jgi:adenine-specific DNA-methyltransferase
MDMSSRRIADSSVNDHLRVGVADHQPTRVAPEELLQGIPDDTVHHIAEKQEAIRSTLGRIWGAPWYASPGFLLYHGDCLRFLEAFRKADLTTDLALTSPPYNIGKEYEEKLPVNSYVNWCGRWMTAIFEATAPAGSFWLNLGYLEVPGRGLCVPISYLVWDKSPFYLLQEVVWHYGAGVSTTKRLCPRNEKWLFCVKNPARYTFNLDDIRDPNVKYPNQKKNGKFRCNPLGKNPSDVWSIPKVTTGARRSSKERTAHPAQFPLGLVRRIILASSNAGDTVLDPFAGSCSSGLAAMGLGRLFVGVEINERYCKLAAERFEKFKQARRAYRSQEALF